MTYFYYTLRPKPGMKIVIQDPGGKQREMAVLAKVKEGKAIKDFTGPGGGMDYFKEILESENERRLQRNVLVSSKDNLDLVIWKMPSFVQDPADMYNRMADVRKYKALILDLRGNGGGRVDALEELIGNFFDHDIKIADLKGRKKMDPMLAKTRGSKYFTGKLVVLIDSRSASASEIFARLVQLEKRGTVIGDRSAGAVMQSLQYSHTAGVEVLVLYGASVTNADVIMSDGKSIEHTGVTPDETLLLTGPDLANKRDPVLSRAAALLGVELSPEKAGALFPVEWKP